MSNARIIPDSITAGVAFAACAALSAYPAPDWSLTLFLRGPAVIDLDSVDDGTAHDFAALAAVTAAWAPGSYAYTIRATNGGDVIEVESGRVQILPDLAAAGAGFDSRSHARKSLDAIEAVIEKRATLDQERYRINNRELYRTPIADLLRLRNEYRAEVRREERREKGRNTIRQIRVRMG